MRLLPHFALVSLLASTACTPAQTAQTPASVAEREGAAAEQKPEEESPKQKGPPADVLYGAHEAVPASPADCPQASPLPKQRACDDARPRLAAVLAAEATGYDAGLSELEACSEFPAGILRALRIELGQAECGDHLVEPIVGEGADASTLAPDVRETLVALGLGARLRRLAVNAPKAPTSRKKEDLDGYFQEALFPWITDQANAIFQMARQGAALSGYARGVVAVEAGNADMRFVEIARDVPITEEIAKEEQAKELYYATLDEQLEPRKARGRNAALVGLKEMARLGVRNGTRLNSARALLSRAYGGRRVNALDTLLMPAVAPEKAESDSAAIASLVPTSYAAALVGTPALSPNLVRAHLNQGVSVSLRRSIEAAKKRPVEKLLLARGLFESGRTFFRAEDFQAASAVVTPLLDAEKGKSGLTEAQLDEAVLIRSLSVALLAGPKDATEMLAKGPRFAEALGNLVMLDALAERGNELGGRAAFNAAYLRELIAPPGSPEYWSGLSKRYRQAATKLKGNEQKLAQDRAKACQDLERFLRQGPPPAKAQPRK